MAAEAVNIKVAVRCRPMNDAEKQKRVSSVISCMTEQKKLVFETGTGKVRRRAADRRVGTHAHANAHVPPRPPGVISSLPIAR